MVGYSLLMLLNQALVGTTGSMNWGMGGGMGGDVGSGMNGGMAGGMDSTMSAGITWDLGMIALSVLMLVSGVIMSRTSSGDSDV